MIDRLKTLILNRKAISFAGITFSVVMVLVYIGTVNSVATAGFQVSQLEQEIASLKKERANLQLEASALGSMQRVETESQSLSLTPIAEVEYINTASSVAVR